MKNNKEEERGFKGIWIPKEVWENKDLTLMEKIALVEINSYDNELGCIASNSTLCRNLDIKPNTFGNIIRSLETKGLLKTSYDDMNCYSGRVIKVVKERFFGIKTTPLENQEPPLENQEPPLENQEHSNSFSNSFSNKKDIYGKIPKKSKKEFIKPTLSEVIEFFKSKGLNSDLANKAYTHYDMAEWKDSRGNKVVNWKQKMNTNWISNNLDNPKYKAIDDSLFGSSNQNESPGWGNAQDSRMVM